ncbi:GNAT family N-acetyltransferase [Corynebacterium variabile]|uniref:GNAT family N-acetyltransferase n=1 Tax=Corynebacterium variabile TaxID=1727 RepID=UPI003F96CB83
MIKAAHLLPSGLTRKIFSLRDNHQSDPIPPSPQGYTFTYQWDSPRQVREDHDLLIYFIDSEEVGRVTFVTKRSSWGLGIYPSVPDGNFSEIKFIDIREKYRRKGYGQNIVRDIEDLSAHDIIIALAEDEGAEAFWEAIGWHLSDLPSDGRSRKLYSNHVY